MSRTSSGVPVCKRRALVEHGDAVGERQRLRDVVRDENDRNLERRPQGSQLPLQVLTRHAIDGRERLVEQEHAGPARQRAGERDALALAAGERGRAAVFQAFQTGPAPRERRATSARSAWSR